MLGCGCAGRAMSSPPTTVATAQTLTRYFVENQDCAAVSRTDLPVIDIAISQAGTTQTIRAEVASTVEEKQQGLMCRDRLAPGTGMLFTYETPSNGGYWMFNTYVPLDILYIAENGAVISVASMAPCPRSTGENQQRWRDRCASASADYRPSGPYIAALELPAGWLRSNGFTTSDAGTLNVDWVR